MVMVLVSWSMHSLSRGRRGIFFGVKLTGIYQTWYSEAWFSEHTLPFSYLYDVDVAARFVGYTTGRTSFDIGCVIHDKP